MAGYWFTFTRPLRVLLPDIPKAQNFRWYGIYGVQIGSWFIGAIKGDGFGSADANTRPAPQPETTGGDA